MDLAILIKAVDQASGPIGQVSKSLGGLDAVAATTGKVIAGVGLAAGGALVGGLVASISAAADFESKLSSIGAVSGATAEEMSQLSGLALQLGADTAFSASEAAAGIEELIKGGLSIADVMGGGAKAALDLAAAGEISVAEAAEIAANAVGQFGLKGEELSHAADLIAGAANASSLSVGDFKFSLSAVGAVAAQVGLSFDETAVAIAEMGKAGIKGSDAGTSLKTMLMSIAAPTDKAKGLMRDLGLETVNLAKASELAATAGASIQDANDPGFWQSLNQAVGENMLGVKDWTKATEKQRKEYTSLLSSSGALSSAFFDQTGSMKSMAEVQQVLQDALAGMNDQQKMATLDVLFGSDAIRAGAILAKEGAAGYNEMAAAMGNVTAADVAAGRLNNLNGSMQALQGSLETAAITLGLAFTPALKGVVDAATQMVNQTVPMLKQFGEQLPTIMAQASTAFDQIRSAVEPVIPIIAGLAAAFATLVVANTIAAGILAIGAAFASAGTAIAAAGGILATVVAVLGGPLTLIIAGIIFALAGLYIAWQQNWFGIQEIMTAVGAVLLPLITAVWTELSRFALEIAPLTEAAWNNMLLVATTVWTALQTFFVAMMPLFVEMWTAHHELIQTVASAAWEVITTAITVAWEIIQGLITAGLQMLAGDWDGAWKTMGETVNKVWETIKSKVGPAWQAISGAVVAELSNLVSVARDAGSGMVQGFIDGIMSKLGQARQTVLQMVEDIRALLPHSDADEGPLSDLVASGRALGKTFASGIADTAHLPALALRPGLAGAGAALPAGVMSGASGGVSAQGSGGVTVVINNYASITTERQLDQVISDSIGRSVRRGTYLLGA